MNDLIKNYYHRLCPYKVFLNYFNYYQFIFYFINYKQFIALFNDFAIIITANIIKFSIIINLFNLAFI